MTLSEYCTALPTVCHLGPERVCTTIWFGSDWEAGCGYIRVTYWGDVGDRVVEVYTAASGTLVYHWFNGMNSTGCTSPLTVGTPPVCDDWSTACTFL